MSAKISVIIPFFWKRQQYLKEFLDHASNLDYENYEILIVSNVPVDIPLPKHARVIMTDLTKRGEKQDLGIRESKGSIIVLVGDDTYPEHLWLRNAAAYFEHDEVVAVGGPGLTPPNDSPLQKASGFIYESILGAGPTRFRHSLGKPRLCDDLPATNLFVRKDHVLHVGGVGIPYRSGEDTFLCSKLAGLGKMIYAPDVVVYHHRRTLLRGHLRQIWGAGLHRGYFAKAFGSTSRRPLYFIPMFAVILLPFVILLAILEPLIGILIVLSAAVVSIEELLRSYVKIRNLKAAILVPIGMWLTHLTYGIGFVRGILLRSDETLYERD